MKLSIELMEQQNKFWHDVQSCRNALKGKLSKEDLDRIGDYPSEFVRECVNNPNKMQRTLVQSHPANKNCWVSFY